MHDAVAAGAHGLELDVHCTNDDCLVVAHDDKLSHMTGADGSIRKSSLHTLLGLDAARNWVPGKVWCTDRKEGDSWKLRDGGELGPIVRIPTLDEVFEAFPDTPLNLEIKSCTAARPLADFLQHRPHPDVIVVSIRDWWLWRFRRRNADLPTAAGGLAITAFWLLSRVRLGWPFGRHVALQVPWKLGPKRICDVRLVDTAHRHHLAVHVWTVDDPDTMHAAIDIGVDGIMTDRPTVLAQVLKERPVGWLRPESTQIEHA